MQNVRGVAGPFAKIVKEEQLSDMSENYTKTSWQCSNVGKKMSTEDLLDVPEFCHLEGITASVSAAKIPHRPEVVSGPEKRDSSRESILERNADSPPQAPDSLQLVHNNFLETNKGQDQELTFSSSVEADKTQEQSRVLFSNSQEERSCVLLSKPQEKLSCVMPDNSQEEITSLEQEITSSESSAVECVVVFLTNPSTVDKPNKHVSQMEKKTEDSLQQVRLNEGKSSFRDNGELSQTEYITESTNFEPTNKNFDCSLLENSSLGLHGFVEYVHVADYSGDLEIGSLRGPKKANAGLKEFEVNPHASDITKEKWSAEDSSAKTYNNESSNCVYRIFLSTHEDTGKITNPEVIPECCPMCYKVICPSRITVDTQTFDMMTVCTGCELSISIVWWTKADAGVNKKRLPEGRKRRGRKPRKHKVRYSKSMIKKCGFLR